MEVKIFTIGFTKKTAARFFSLIRDAGVRRVVDTRLNRTSQLAGFAKEQDLPFFLREICHTEYESQPLLAPTEEMLSDYKKKQIDWQEYEHRFNSLIHKRQIEVNLKRSNLDHACLLCSEDQPHHCHRRLVAEYLGNQWKNVTIAHL